MAILKKINPFSKTNPDTGFGVQANQIGGRFVNKDGSFNIQKEGLPLWERFSVYSWFLDLSWSGFFGIILFFYIVENLLFTSLYFLVGYKQLTGIMSVTTWKIFKEVFFFSTETFTTVGYGRVNPLGDGAHLIAALESMTGFLSFALVTGLLYGRFTRPRAYLAFSDKALISPYKDGTALMFRIVPYKINHHLTDARIVVNLGFMVVEEDQPVYKFFQLKLERSRIDTFSMNWTVVHPIDEESPLLNFSLEDMKNADIEIYVQVMGFNHVFSNLVMQQTSYTYAEIVWGAKFKPMYKEAEDGTTTILQIDRLNDYEKVSLEINN